MTDAPLTALPPETLDGHIGILATSGAGKTYGAKTAVEDLLEAGRRVCVIDPTGVWWGLRAGPDGKAGGYPVAIIGGDHADVPLAEGSGAALAQAVAEGAFSAIIDVSRLTVGARTRLFTDFAEELARANRRPLHLVIDEAHIFMPQGRVNDPQSGKMVGAANHLVSAGRALGLRLVLVSQRPAKVHKDSLSQIGTLVAMWMTAPQDTSAVKAWIADVADPAQGREVLASLPSLQVGHGWVWAPRASCRRCGSALDEAAPTARLSALPIEELRAALAAEEPATAESAPTKRASKGEIEAAEQRGYERGYRLGLSDGERREWVRWSSELQARNATMLEKLIGDLQAEKNERVPSSPTAASATPPPGPKQAKLGRAVGRPPPTMPDASTAGSAPGELGASARKLLEVLRAPNLPDFARRWSDLAVLAVLAPTGGSFNAARRQLLDSGRVIDTAKGLQALAADALPSAAASDAGGAPIDVVSVVEAWCRKLGGSARRILSSLYVGPATKAELSKDLELAPKGGSWNAAWKMLRSNGLVEEVDGGKWRMTFVLLVLKRERTS